jgi:hypothetical protein
MNTNAIHVLAVWLDMAAARAASTATFLDLELKSDILKF